MKHRLPPIAAFPHVHWSHNWERIHEVISRLATFSPSVTIHAPYGLMSPSLLSIAKKFTAYKNRQSITGTQNPLPQNAQLAGGFFIPFQFNVLFDSLNFQRIESRNPEPFSENLVYATYANGFVLKAISRAKISILDLTQRRQTDPQLSLAAKTTEAKAVKMATLVLADNHSVIRDYQNLRNDIVYLPQGVDVSRFSPDGNFSAEVQQIKKKYRFVAGYCGTDKALDLKFYTSLIQSHSELAFVYAGRLSLENKAALRKHQNFFYLGNKDFYALPEVYRAFDCGLIPYQINDFTEGVFPTKMLEYLASGVPVLSTALPEILPFAGDVVNVVEGFPEAENKLLPLIRAKRELRDNCTALASENSWQARIETLLVRLEPHLKSGPSHH